MSGEKNPNYKGSEASYKAINKWVRKRKELSNTCQECGCDTKKLALCCIGVHSRDPNQYKWLCWSCKNKGHKKKVYTKEELNERRKNYDKWYRKTKYKQEKQLIDIIVGEKCEICNKKGGKLACHRKNGEPHGYQTGGGKKQRSYLGDIIKREKQQHGQFVRLCVPCHLAVHWCMNNLGLSWEQIKELHNTYITNKKQTQ